MVLASLSAVALAQPRDTVIFAVDQGLEGDLSLVTRAEIALRGLDLSVLPALAGESVDERERVARLLAQERRAIAILWIEPSRTEVRATTPAGPMRFATLPRALDDLDVRVLAVIAGSVLDEALSPPGLTSPVSSTLVPEPPPAPPSAAPIEVAVTLAAPRAPAPPPEPAPPSEPEDAAAESAADDELAFYGVLDTMVGVVWSVGSRNTDNIGQAVGRLGVGATYRDLRVEVLGAGGLEMGIDGSYPASYLAELDLALAGVVRSGDASFDLGGVIGGAVHTLLDSHESRSDASPALRLGALFGFTLPDEPSSCPFRFHVEVGGFARNGPLPIEPFVDVTIGVALR